MAKAINNETRSTSLKKFKPKPEIYNGLCLGALTDVSVTEAEVKVDSNMETFRGHTIPRLNFVFESRNDPKGVKKSTYIHSYLAIEHTPESLVDGTDGGAWRWNQLSQTVKHLLDVFRDYKPLTPEEVKMLMVDFEDEKDGVFVEQPTEVVIEAYTKFFNNIVQLFNPGGKAIYKDANGKDRIIWMKLLLDINGRPVNNGDYGFSGYPGEGLIELYQDKVPSSLSINVAKGENIIPRAMANRTASGKPGVKVQDIPIPDNEAVPSFMRGSE